MLIDKFKNRNKLILFAKKGSKTPSMDEILTFLYKDKYIKDNNIKEKLIKQYKSSKSARKAFLNSYNEKINNINNNFKNFQKTDDSNIPEEIKINNDAKVANALEGVTPRNLDMGSPMITFGYLSQYDEPQRLEQVLKRAPQIALNELQMRNLDRTSNLEYSKRVKHTMNDKYYDSLISKANAQYGTNFKSREDVAAFQERMGVTKIDGIIGPETEALLSFYYPRQNLNSINTRRMYQNESNQQVADRTSNILAYGQQQQPENIFGIRISEEYSPGNIYPGAFTFTNSYTSPYTKYLLDKYYKLDPDSNIEILK